MSDRVELPPVPTWLAALPFLFSPRGTSDEDLLVNSALASAAAAMAADPDRRDSRSRICFLLAELASQYGRRTGDHSGWIPVTRSQLATVAQINLTKVKRVLGFLLLSGVIELGSEGVRVIDWKRLCALADYDPSWGAASGHEEEEQEEIAPASRQQAEQPRDVTAAGDPASFV